MVPMPDATLNNPVPATEPPSARNEQRLVGRALTHWDQLRGTRRFPGHLDYLNDDLPYDGANTFVVRINDSELTDEVVSAGDAVTEAFGRNPVGCAAIDVLPSSTEMGLSFCRTAMQMKKPIADVGSFTNALGKAVYYRSILLPLSGDQENIDHVLCAFSFKFLT